MLHLDGKTSRDRSNGTEGVEGKAKTKDNLLTLATPVAALRQEGDSIGEHSPDRFLRMSPRTLWIGLARRSRLDHFAKEFAHEHEMVHGHRLAACFAGLSCGSSSNSSSNTIPRAEACAQASQAACAKVFACPATTDLVVAAIQASLGGTEDACKTTIQAMYCNVLECATAADYHGDKAAQCKQQFTDVTCSRPFSGGAGRDLRRGAGLSGRVSPVRANLYATRRRLSKRASVGRRRAVYGKMPRSL